jgi:hypothetical protein
MILCEPLAVESAVQVQPLLVHDEGNDVVTVSVSGCLLDVARLEVLATIVRQM